MAKMVKMTKLRSRAKQAPSEEEVAERERQRIAANREVLREAVALAREAFSTERPTPEMAIAVSQMIEGGVERESIPTVVRAALLEAEKLALANIPLPRQEARAEAAARSSEVREVAIQILDVLLDDDQAEEHLAEARDEARLLFGSGASARACLDVYFQVYAEDEPV
mgnify:CR=1 FL=1